MLASAPFSLTQGQSKTIALQLTATGRKRLAHAKRRPVAAAVVVSVDGGATSATRVLVR